MQLGDVQAFIQYSRQFTVPLSQVGSMANLLQSGVASAERVFSLLDEDEQSPDAASGVSVDGAGRGRGCSAGPSGTTSRTAGLRLPNPKFWKPPRPRHHSFVASGRRACYALTSEYVFADGGSTS